MIRTSTKKAEEKHHQECGGKDEMYPLLWQEGDRSVHANHGNSA